MNKKLLTLLLAAGIAAIFTATGLYAGSVPDVIKMDYNDYKKRKKAPPKTKFVEFTHEKHATDYKISCGDCHHDKDAKPLADLKPGDAVQKCSECHDKMEVDKKNKKDIKALENAMHGNCVECHKEVNIKAGDPKGRKGPAPTTCAKCHEKA